MEAKQAEQKTPLLIKQFMRLDIRLSRIACGGKHTLALSTEGHVYSFGCATYGALGRQGSPQVPERVDLSYRIDIVSCGENSSICASADSGHVFHWGTLGRRD